MRIRESRQNTQVRHSKLIFQILAATFIAGSTASAEEHFRAGTIEPTSIADQIRQVSSEKAHDASFRDILASHVLAVFTDPAAEEEITTKADDQGSGTDKASGGNFDEIAPPVPKKVASPKPTPAPEPIPTPIPEPDVESNAKENVPQKGADIPPAPVPMPIPDSEFDQIPSSSDLLELSSPSVEPLPANQEHSDSQHSDSQHSDSQHSDHAPSGPEPLQAPFDSMKFSPESLPMENDVHSIIDPALMPAPFDPASAFESTITNPEKFVVDDLHANQVPRGFSSTRPALGAVAGAYSPSPAMIGDFFGGTFTHGTSPHGQTVSLAGGDRRFKVSENVSPLPQDRLFFNYNHFHNALRDVNEVKQDLDRFVLGFEKTFWDGRSSLEWRLPLAGGLNSTQTIGSIDTEGTELGNLAFAFKTVLKSGCDWKLTGGTTMTLPTGDNFQRLNPAPELIVRNDAVHLAPFLGYIRTPRGPWFFQSFLQVDIDLNGNDVRSAGGFEGVLQDQNLLFVDMSLGKWLFRSCDPCDRVSGVALISELHYTTTLNDTDDVAGLSNQFNRMDILNATGAVNIQLGRTALRIGAAAPLRKDEERLFDAEVIFQMNRYF